MKMHADIAIASEPVDLGSVVRVDGAISECSDSIAHDQGFDDEGRIRYGDRSL